METNAMSSLSKLNGLPGRKLQTPERNLLVAMIQRAIFDFMGNREFDKESAAEWLFDNPGSGEVFSFDWVCAQLDLEPEVITERVKNMTPREGLHCQRWWGLQRYGSSSN